VRTPHEYLASLTRFVTADVSGQVGADVLLLAGVEDHYVPFRQFGDQLNTLTCAGSVTARVFTREERLRQHKDGYRSSRYVRKHGKHGKHLRPGLYRRSNPIATREEADAMEQELARHLRNRGYPVYGGH
jgi:hypothetical protein